MKELLEQGFGILPVGIVGGIGLLVRFFLVGYYGILGKACRRFGKTKNQTISYIREDLAFRKKNNIGMKNAMVYIECRLAECKVLGMRLGSLEGIAEQSMLLVVLSGVLLAFAGVLWNCEGRQILFILFAGGVSFFGLFLVDLVTGLREKHKRIRLAIRDYIENGEHMDEEDDTVACPNAFEKEKRRKKEVLKTPSGGYLKRAEGKKKSKRKNCKAQEEKRRLTEELLRDRRQMEARGFAQIRREESKEAEKSQQETMIKEVEQQEVIQPTEEAIGLTEQAHAEAAATRCTYEDLLSEVLAEYLV